MTSPRRIVFLGTHGQHNIGDELLLESFLAQLGPEHHYVINSYDPAATMAQLSGRYDVEVIDTARARLRLARELMRCDLLCFGGGSIVKELYASTGRNRYSTLLMILALVTFTHRIARRPIAMLNVGVGPLRTRRGLRLARLILSQVDELTVRDEKSFSTCLAIGVDAELATDAAFAASPDWLLGPDQSSTAPVHSVSPPLFRVALNLNFDIANPDNWQTFLEGLAETLKLVHERRPIELHAAPMQVGFKANDDADILDSFAARVPAIAFHRHDLRDHRDVARLIASADLVISERFHAVVIASILGVPSFVLAYDVKVNGLAETLGLTEWSVDINEPFEADDVAGKILDLIDRKDAASARVAARSGELAQEARHNFSQVRAWISAVPPRKIRSGARRASASALHSQTHREGSSSSA